MANPEHVALLLEGVEAWNTRREKDDFVPDLSRLNVHNEFQEKGRIDTDRQVRLNSINLSGAKLFGADLRHSLLFDANLSAADLTLSDLRGAHLDGADLSDADLTAAKIQCADLREAKLFRTNLAKAEPWTAHLYPRPDGMMRSTPELPSQVATVADLLDVCRILANHYSRDVRIPMNPLQLRQLNRRRVVDDVTFYFRGERCSCKSWKLRPSVLRLAAKKGGTLRQAEGDMLFDLMSRRPEEFNGLTAGLGQWVLAQHHGLKTRLLDITRNPLVALFHASKDCSKPDTEGKNNNCDQENGRLHVFAVPEDLIRPFNSDTISVLANFAKLRGAEQDFLLGIKREEAAGSDDATDNPNFASVKRRLNHFIRQEKPYFEDRINLRDLFRVFVVEPQQSFERIRAQSGAFLISAFHERFERDEIVEWNEDTPIYDYYVLTVPDEVKGDVLHELGLLNITDESLLPGLDEAARAVIRRYSVS